MHAGRKATAECCGDREPDGGSQELSGYILTGQNGSFLSWKLKNKNTKFIF